MIRDGRFWGRKCGSFTLQWHLTNACPYYCKHCYDRSDRQELTFAKSIDILADLQQFCRNWRVKPHTCFSGGDPLSYPYFWDLYKIVAEKGIKTSILGNPVSQNTIGKLLQIQPPVYYQVSLEGLREHNDSIRGSGHFDQVMTFLAHARQLDLETHVMLTLTRANIDQVIPLGEELRGLTPRFTFNRLSQTGGGQNLEVPTKKEFSEFLRNYMAARRINPILGYKDNLFNIIRYENHQPLFPGCTGFGCGAAFNFVALLPDGEVHACRKYPSLIGNIHKQGLLEIYESKIAGRYRAGTTVCQQCPIKTSCGGCSAVSYGQNLDPFNSRDPFCFISERKSVIKS